MKLLHRVATCVIAITTVSCSDTTGPTGKVFDLKSGAIAIQLRGSGEGSIGVDLSSIRKVQDNRLATWFIFNEGRTTGYFTTNFECGKRQARMVQRADSDGIPVQVNEAARLVIPNSHEEVVMNYLCPAWWKFWK